MRTLAIVLLSMALTIMLVQGFTWGWLAVAVITGLTLVFTSLTKWARETFRTG